MVGKARLALLAALAYLAGCAGPSVTGRFSYQPPARAGLSQVITWPNAREDQPRYVHVGELLGEQNFDQGVGKSRLKRFLLWLAGDDEERSPLELLRPVSITIAPDGNRIYVADMANGAILVFDPKAGELHRWEDVPIGEPNGLVSLPDGRLLVADALGKRVRILTAEGRRGGDIGLGTLARPVGLAWDRVAQELYVADTAAHDIKVFRLDGTLVRTVGRRGVAPGEFNFPSYLALSAGRLYVSDTMNSRVQVLDARTGESLLIVGRLGTRVGDLVRPKGIAVDYDGNIYVAESLHDFLIIYNAKGELLLPIGGSGRGTGQFVSPVSVLADAGGRVYVVDMFNGRVSVMQYLGGEDE